MCPVGAIDFKEPLLLPPEWGAGSSAGQGGPYKCQLLRDQYAWLNGKAVDSTVIIYRRREPTLGRGTQEESTPWEPLLHKGRKTLMKGTLMSSESAAVSAHW